MRATVKLNDAAIHRLKKAQLTALEQTAEAVKTEAINAQVMPFDSGYMQNDSTSINTDQLTRGRVSITTDTPYARKLYYHPEYNFQTVNNPNAKGMWWEDWINGSEKDFAHKTYRELYKRLTGV